mmetsp:Transcript_4682/g.12478  ORF Transcript_4682/g.12478 Transcript_4682/m.12478 type:complete len:81 (-) Transcript_4682:375-617(-)
MRIRLKGTAQALLIATVQNCNAFAAICPTRLQHPELNAWFCCTRLGPCGSKISHIIPILNVANDCRGYAMVNAMLSHVVY